MGLTFGDLSGVDVNEPKGQALLDQLAETLAAIRAVTGDAYMIGVDAHAGGIPDPMSREEALAVAKVLERFGVAFFEEPLSYLDRHGYAWLRQRTSVPISGGESPTGAWSRGSSRASTGAIGPSGPRRSAGRRFGWYVPACPAASRW